jgi:hypothetical protein
VETKQDIEPALVPDREPPETRKPGQRALDNPAVTAQALAALYAASGNPRGDTPPLGGPPAAVDVVALVGVELDRPLAGPPRALPDRRHRVDQLLEAPAVVLVGRAESEGERDAVGVDQNVALRPQFAPVGRVRPGRLAPFLAGNEALSREQRPK